MMKIARRRFLGTLSTAGVAGLLPQLSLAENHEINPDESFDFLTEPYLQNLSDNSACIFWIVSKNSYSWVEIGEKGAAKRKVQNSHHGLVDANNRLNRITVNGLKPGTVYEYTVHSKEFKEFHPYKIVYGETIKKGPFTFKTTSASDPETKFLVFNDLHDHPEILLEMSEKHTKKDEYDFVVVNGDAFDWLEDEQRIIKDLLAPCGQFFSTEKQLILTQGNHEVRGSFARQMFNYFDYPDNRTYYAFTRGPVRFIVLDSGEDKEDEHPVYGGINDFDAHREEQARWFAEEMESRPFKKADFRVVLIHIPLYHAGDWHGTTHCRKVFGELFNKAKIDLEISGHTHKWGTYPADPATHNYPIVIGGGPKPGARTIMKVKATKSNLDLVMIDDSGKEVGAFHLKRK